MSEVQHSVQDTPAATTATTEPTTTETGAAVEQVAPAGEVTAAAPTSANSVNPIKEEKVGKGEELITSKPISEGVLNFKGPGLKGLIFSKKYFWLNEEPLNHNHLSTYLSNERSHEIAHPNVAQATQSGKGLLFYAKRAEDKDHPQGILNIADMSDIAKGDFNDFSVKLHGKNHTFQALNKNERDAWIVSLEPRIADAKAHRETLMATPGYKSALEKYSKPTTAGTISKSRSLSRPGKASKSNERVKEASKDTPAVGATTATPAVVDPAATPTTSVLGDTTASTADKVTDTPVETSTTAAPTHHHGEAAAVDAAVGAGAVGATKAEKEDKLEKKASRSQSRGNKRSSIFGGLLGKKEDKDEKKAIKKEEKEEKKEIKAEEKAEEKELKAEKKELRAEEKAEKKEERALEKELKHEGTGAVGGFDAAAVASRVMGEPVVNQDVEASTSAAPATETATTAPTDGIAHKTLATGDGAADVTPTSATSKTPATATNMSKLGKRNSVFGGLFGKKDTPRSTATETAPVVPAKDQPVKDEPSTVASTAPQLDNPVTSSTTGTTAGAATEAPTTASTGVAAATSEPAVEKAVEPAAGSSAAPPVAATTTPTDKRRTSFFSGLGTKKEKSAGATSGDESTDGEGKKSGGVGGLFRKASRAVSKPANSSATSTSAAKPAVPAATGTGVKADETVAEAKAANAIEEPSSKVVPATEGLPNGTDAATDGEKSHLVPGEVGSTAIASHEKTTPVEATA